LAQASACYRCHWVEIDLVVEDDRCQHAPWNAQHQSKLRATAPTAAVEASTVPSARLIHPVIVYETREPTWRAEVRSLQSWSSLIISTSFAQRCRRSPLRTNKEIQSPQGSWSGFERSHPGLRRSERPSIVIHFFRSYTSYSPRLFPLSLQQ